MSQSCWRVRSLLLEHNPAHTRHTAPAALLLLLGCAVVLKGGKLQPQLLLLRPLPQRHVPRPSGLKQQLIK